MGPRKVIWASLFFLAFAVSFLQGQARSGTMQIGVSFGGIYGTGYSYEYTDPSYLFGGTLRITDDLSAWGVPSIGLSAGYFVSSRMEIFCGGFYLSTGHYGGSVLISIPRYYSFTTDTGYDRQDRSLSKFDILIGAKYHFPSQSKIKPYVGVGLSYSSASLQFLSDALFSYSSDKLNITSVDLKEMKMHALGGFAMGGAELGLVPRLAVFAELLFEFARSSVTDPFSMSIDSPESVRVDLGGFMGFVGFRFHF